MLEKALYCILQKYWSHCRSRQIFRAGLKALASRTSPKKHSEEAKKVLIFVHLRWPKLELRCHTYEESNKSYGTHHQNACRVEEEAMSFSNTTKPIFFSVHGCYKQELRIIVVIAGEKTVCAATAVPDKRNRASEKSYEEEEEEEEN
jgi:hypothetical protein